MSLRVLRYHSLHLELTNARPRFLEVKFLPSHSFLQHADAFCFCATGPTEGLGDELYENSAALLHRCLWRRVCGWDRPPLSWKDGRRSSVSAPVLPGWFTADETADFKRCSQGTNPPDSFPTVTLQFRVWLRSCTHNTAKKVKSKQLFLVLF